MNFYVWRCFLISPDSIKSRTACNKPGKWYSELIIRVYDNRLVVHQFVYVGTIVNLEI